MIFKECPCGWIHLLKAHWLRLYTTLVLIISDPSVKCASSSIYSEGIVAVPIKDKSAWDVVSDSYRFENGVLGPVMKNSPHWDIVNCSYAPAFVISRPLLKISETTQSYCFRNTVLLPVKEHSVNGCTVYSSSDYAVAISGLWQTISLILPTSTLRKPALATWGYCEPFLCLSSCDFASLCEGEFMNTVSGRIKKHHGRPLHSFSDYTVVISKLWQTISEILPTNTHRKPALATWGYCKPFLCPWSGDFASLYEVEFKYTVLKQVKEHHGGTGHNNSNHAVVISRFWDTLSEILPINTLRKPALATWGYCKPFLCLWSCDNLSLCEVDFKNTVMVVTMWKIQCFASMKASYLSICPMTHLLESNCLLCIVALSSNWCELVNVVLDPKYGLACIISFGTMFTLTIYLLLLSSRYNGFTRKRVARRRNLGSCIWTRRRVMWLHSGKSRYEYVLEALQGTSKARAYYGKKLHERNEGLFTTSCSNIVTMGTNGFREHKTICKGRLLPMGIFQLIICLISFVRISSVVIHLEKASAFKDQRIQLLPKDSLALINTTESQYPSGNDGHSPDHREKTKIQKPSLLTSTLRELGMGPEFSSDIAGDGPRKRIFDEDDFDPELEQSKKRKTWNSRRSKLTRQIDSAKHHSKRSKDDRRKDNAKQNPKRSTDDRRKDNAKQISRRSKKLKNDISGMEYDTSSPFPPTAEQLTYTGKILENSIAALFAQQSPSPEISYAVVVAEQVRSYTRPIIDFTMHQFEYECCHRLFGDLNIAKAAANKALHNLDKILLINDHYQLMWDFSVWDVCNPPSLSELKLLSTRHPYQPISELLRKEIDSFKKQIHAQIESIRNSRKNNSEGEKDSQDQGFCRRYSYLPSERYCWIENNMAFNVVGGRHYES